VTARLVTFPEIMATVNTQRFGGSHHPLQETVTIHRITRRHNPAEHDPHFAAVKTFDLMFLLESHYSAKE
jgi:hypothetical protein